ncbi:MAG: GspE/PulE family protein, partial [Blastocatellia bacterium]
LTELSQLARRILLEANARGASDIFVESGENIGRICFRQDGLVNLHIQNIPPPVIRQLVNIFANMAGVSSHELHLKIVDGNLTLRGVPTSRGPINADYRCCFTPTRRGVDLTLRNNFEEVRPIKDIGFEDDTLSAVLMALGRPQGLILLCGPTGQGKSITREAMLRILEDRQCLKIFEWGNPIEFPSERRTQVEIDRSSQLTWEEVSKAALRCSPNVITPSEFRDDTEAQWVVKASATGHLVITTFHATNIAAAFTRLMHLQVRPYDLAEHLTAVVSQRLVRLLCPYCKVPDAGAQALGYPNAYTRPQELVHTRARVALPWQKVDPRSSLADVQVIGKAEGPVNCPHCADEGYRGRTAVLEVL